MKIGSCQTDSGKFLLRHHNAGRIGIGVQGRLNGQSLLGSRMGDQVDDDVERGQWLTAPVQRDVAEHPVLNLVPFARTRRKMTHRDAHPQFVGQSLQGHCPQPPSTAITPSTIGCDQQGRGLGIERRAHRTPPPSQRFDGKFRRVVINADTDPARVSGQIVALYVR
jgi:hypothetical protein